MAKKRLLLVGWDSADWKIIQPLMDRGALRTLRGLVERGVSGNLNTLEPQLSPMLWTSIVTGKMAYHHGVAGFTEVDPRNGAIVPVSAATRKCRTLWEMLAEHGYKGHVVNWFATQGERDLPGKVVSNMFGHLPDVAPDSDPASWPAPPPGTFWPPELGDLLREDRVSRHDLDPDQVIRLFVPQAERVDQAKDPRLAQLAQHLAEAFSAHNAAVRVMELDPEWDFFAVYYRTIDEICHRFMPYHAPRMEGIPEEDFELYQHVVTQAYFLHDLMLRRLLDRAGPDTAVLLVSDHGFHSDHLRPKFTPRVPAGITVWHRPQGVIVASGPGFKPDSLVFGARLLDVTPTVLHYFGLPVGEDMEGRTLTEVFAEDRSVASIPSWERTDRPAIPRADLGEDGNRALLEQFVALGYIDQVPADKTRAALETQCENDWSMARAYLYAGHADQALPLLERCGHAQPRRTDFAQALANCQLRLGLLPEAESTIDRARAHFGATPRADLVKASIAIQRGDYRGALALLKGVETNLAGDVTLLLFLAQCYTSLRHWGEAEAAGRRLLAIDPDNPHAHLLLSRIHLHRGEAAAAAEAALTAIGLQYGNPRGHFLLGMALLAQGQQDEARRAFRKALSVSPDHLLALRMLAWVSKRMGDAAAAAAYRREHAERLARLHGEVRRHREQVRAEAAVRQAQRDELDRRQAAAIRQAQAEFAAIEPLEIVVVSGLPRSGTSLMMQMLSAAGIPPLTDGKRTADADNPEGYWEWEDIKQLPRNPRLIEQAKGKVVKVISALLPALPAPHRYKVIYMVRPVAQVVDSQKVMLDRHGQQPRAERQHLIDTQEEHSRQMRQALAKSERVDLLEVSFPDLVAEPGPVVERLAAFLPGRFTPSPAVAAAVKPKLFRNR